MPIQQTFGIIKPDAVSRNLIGGILERIEDNGFKIVAMKMIQMGHLQASSFYDVHKGKPFYNELVDFISSGPVVVMVLEREDAVTYYRELMGATDPALARPKTLRADFAESMSRNAVHGSDSPDNAKREIKFFFTDDEIFSRG